MKYGIEHEVPCLQLFEDKYSNVPVWKNCGLIVNKNYPWLAYSPDAFLVENGELCLLEVKCPKIGKLLTE